MKTLTCVFCDTEVASPENWNDSTARAVCDGCWEKGGRLPRFDGPNPYQFRVDDHGRVIRPDRQRSKWWLTLRKHFLRNPAEATFFTLSFGFIAFLAIALLVAQPLGSLIFLGICTAVFFGWRVAMRRGWV